MNISDLNSRIAKNHTYLLEMKDVNKYMSDYGCTLQEWISRQDRIIADSQRCLKLIDEQA